MYELDLEKILNGSYSIKEKEKLIEELKKNLLKEIRKGYKYCSHCKEYYREKSWDYESETKVESVCIYEDPINSGGNEYKDKEVTRNYMICPRGHKFEM